MKALQLHYTSCRRGRSGGAGFQTRACSDGLSPEEQREIERRSAYRPPRDAEREPSPEQIALDFPRALRFHPLSSGRLALTLSSYCGRDYSGRWGNFFAHTLVFEPGSLGDLWPVDLYEWTGWKSRLEAAEDGEEAPPPLPVVELAGVTPAESFQLAELSAFVRGQEEGVAFLARVGRALLASRSDSRPVVVRDRPVEALFWIAAVLKLFPPRHARRLAVSTYQDDPRSCADLNATSGETDFVWSEAEARYRFYHFDRQSGLASEVAGDPSDYAATTARWLAEQPERLERFHAFLTTFRHERLDAGLAAALDLFLLREDPAALPLGERLVRMVRFAAEHGDQDARLELLGGLEKALAPGSTTLDPADLELLAGVFAEGARVSAEARYRTAAFRSAAALLGQLVEGRSNAEMATRVWSRLGELLPGGDREIAEQALGLVRAHPETLRCSPIGEVLAARLAQLPATGAGELRRWLEGAGGDALLLAEWSILVGASPEPVATFERYRREVLDLLPSYARRCDTQIRGGLLSALPERERSGLALRWLQSGELKGFEPELVTRCLELANRALPLAVDKKTLAWADLVTDAAGRHRVTLRPDRPRLLRALALAQQGRATGPTEADWVGLASDLPLLGADEYETLLEKLLLPALESIRIAREHGKLLAATFRHDQLGSFLDVYTRFFRNGRRDPWPEPLQAALRFWLTFDDRSDGAAPLAALEMPARDLLASALGRLPPRYLEKVERKVRQARLEPRAEALWQRLHQGVTSARGYRLRRWLGARLQQLNPFGRR
ncbi:MAG TPA: hypothetical protein VF017_18430 [Thermoanaerobaculia bacterium]|nr:hypothetical protein [Thermoanaerobaculia bacterium]